MKKYLVLTILLLAQTAVAQSTANSLSQNDPAMEASITKVSERASLDADRFSADLAKGIWDQKLICETNKYLSEEILSFKEDSKDEQMNIFLKRTKKLIPQNKAVCNLQNASQPLLEAVAEDNSKYLSVFIGIDVVARGKANEAQKKQLFQFLDNLMNKLNTTNIFVSPSNQGEEK